MNKVHTLSTQTLMRAIVMSLFLLGGATVAFAAEVTPSSAAASTNSSQQPLLMGQAEVTEVKHTWKLNADKKSSAHTITFKVTAQKGDVYVPIAKVGYKGAIIWSSVNYPTGTKTLGSDAEKVESQYRVKKGETKNFTLSFTTLPNGKQVQYPVKALRYSSVPNGRIVEAVFPKSDMPSRPERPVATTSPVQVNCVSGSSTYPVGTERTSIINADGTTSVISDARFVCRGKDGKGVWEREGSLPGKPTNPICIKGSSVPSNSIQSGGGASTPRPGTHECLGGTSSSTGSTGSSTGLTGGTGTPKPGVSPLPCRHFNKMYANGTRKPTAVGSMSSASSRLTPLVCQNGEWKPIKPQPNASPATTTRSGLPAVRGASTDVRVQMAAILSAMQDFLDEMKPQQ